MNLLIASLLILSSHAAPPVGPVSESEETVLWEDSVTRFQEGRFKEASLSLSRLWDRYPASQHRLEAGLMLAQSWIEVGDCEHATPVLRALVSAKSSTETGFTARVWLGQCQILQKQFHRALLTAVETETRRPAPPAEIRARLLVVKARALLGLNESLRAEKALDSAKELPPATNSAAAERIRIEALQGRLEWKTAICRSEAKNPKPAKDELELKSRLAQRGLCLQETALLYKPLLEPSPVTGEGDKISLSRVVGEARTTLSLSFREYADACRTPYIRQLKSSAEARKKYLAELKDFVSTECRTHFQALSDMVGSWKQPVLKQALDRELESFGGSKT